MPRRRAVTAAKRKPRRRKRFAVNWVAVLWVLALANLVAGTIWSPVTSVRKLRVTGATESDHARIEATAQTFRGVPAIQVDVPRFETLIQAHPPVARAQVRRNPFGRGLLEIVRRRPVAAIEGDAGELLAEDGVLYRGVGPARLPKVRLPGALRGPNAALMAAWEAGAIAELCARLATRLRDSSWTVEVDARGVINLRRPRSGRIVLGSSDRMDEKLAALERVLVDRPGFLARVQELNLTVPANPVYVPKSGDTR